MILSTNYFIYGSLQASSALIIIVKMLAFLFQIYSIFFIRRESVLTTLLTDVLGGNCITNCLVTFKPIKTAASSMILRYAMRLKRIVNYPIQNTPNYKVIYLNFALKLMNKVNLLILSTLKAKNLGR